MLDYIILGFLMWNEKSGYDLKQKMKQSTSNFFDAGFGSIYPALKRLEKKSMISFREIVEGGKYKKLYQINDNGKEAFLDWLEKPIVFDQTSQGHLVNIFFYQFLPKETAITNLKKLIDDVEAVRMELFTYKEEISKSCDVSQYIYPYSTMIYGIDFYQFVINWCNDLIQKLEKSQKL